MFCIQAGVFNLKGINAIEQKDYSRAVALYTEAIAIDGQNSVLYANRSKARVALSGQLAAALADAEEVRIIISTR